ncbi:probable methyltransferase PMT12 [Primulina huaijiensis]|uniref:probable methyltransferase PMT12 n=1 Tax=Primulina huaijiensis TaxID=1492673 RepID=UPI003CC75E79
MIAPFTSSSVSLHDQISSTSLTPMSKLAKAVAFFLLLFSLLFFVKHLPTYPLTTPNEKGHLSFFNPNTAAASPFARPPPRWAKVVVERTGIIDEMGFMTDDFVVGEFDEGLIQSMVDDRNVGAEIDGRESNVTRIARDEKFVVCDESMSDYIPCLDSLGAISGFVSVERGDKSERHCPEIGMGLECLVPRPKHYKIHIPWPKSRDEVWFDNVPNARPAEEKVGQNWISRKDDKLIFPRVEAQVQYLNHISKMVPEIAFGLRTRVVLDIGCGVTSFGASLMEQNVTTLSVSPKDFCGNQIQVALERGVPAMVAAFGTHRLPYPSQAFELIHCSECNINWTRDDGILLLEANRMLRAGGYFVWAAQPSNNYEGNLIHQWEGMADLTSRLCWELMKKEEYIAIWQKPMNNSCYVTRDSKIQPSLCGIDDDPDDIWYVKSKACITRLPENGYGTNVTSWPARLHFPQDRLHSIKMDADTSRKELYKANSKYWNEIVRGYVVAFHIDKMNLRNVMDMKAGYGGFAAALLDFNVNCWVMNVVPVSGSNTLPVIHDRGLIGVMHDWCEPFDTYPRTYDLLNAAGLFSVEQKRCNISSIMLEMDRILRPDGRVYIRDTSVVIDELQEIAKAMRWVTFVFDSGEGPHSNQKLLTCEKRL